MNGNVISRPSGSLPTPTGQSLIGGDVDASSTGPWSLGARAGDFVYVAGMRGINPSTGDLVPDPEKRIRQAFVNMRGVAESCGRFANLPTCHDNPGATLASAVRLVIYVTDLCRYRPIANRIQLELWGQGPYPPRTIVEVHRLNQDDIFEIEGTFYAPLPEASSP